MLEQGLIVVYVTTIQLNGKVTYGHSRGVRNTNITNNQHAVCTFPTTICCCLSAGSARRKLCLVSSKTSLAG